LEGDVALSEQSIDYLDVVSIHLLLKEKLDIQMPDEDLNQVTTIDSIVKYINNKLAYTFKWLLIVIIFAS
jgi:acyl carrier protein